MNDKLTDFLIDVIKNNEYNVVYDSECRNEPDIRIIGSIAYYAKSSCVEKLTIEISLKDEYGNVLHKLMQEMYNE